MTSIRSKILKPVLSLLFLIPLVLMIVFSAGISYYARQWAKEDLIHMANSISTTIKGDEQNIDRVIHLINTVKGSSSVEVIFYNPSRKIARIIRNQDSFVDEQIEKLAYDAVADLSPGTIGDFTLGGNHYYVVEIDRGETQSFEKAVYISQGLPVDGLLRTIHLGLLVIAAASIAAAVVLTSRITNSIAGPIERMTQIIGKTETGTPQQIQETSDVKELNQLISEFNSMSSRIDQYQQSQRFFLSEASHELRTPLMSIQGYADGIAMGVFEDYKETAQLISNQSKRLTRLVESLLTLARAEHFNDHKKLERMDLDEFLPELLDWYQGIAETEQKTIKADIQPGVFVQGNDELLTVSVGNILSNAIRYAKSTVYVSLSREKNSAVIQVADDGPGISGLQDLFQKFSKGKDGKFGLGLFIAKMAVQAMNGRIEAYNRQGAVFEIVLPCLATDLNEKQ